MPSGSAVEAVEVSRLVVGGVAGMKAMAPASAQRVGSGRGSVAARVHGNVRPVRLTTRAYAARQRW